MATDSDNVLVALTGAVLTAPTGTTAPTATGTTWGTGWVDLGYISEDGVTEAHEDDTNDIVAWQNGDTVRTLISGSASRYTFTVIETTAAALQLYYRGAELTGTGTGPATLSIGSPVTGRSAFGFDVVDGTRLIRWVVPSGEVTERGEVVYSNSEAIGFELTITAYPGPDGIHTIRYYSTLAGLPTP